MIADVGTGFRLRVVVVPAQSYIMAGYRYIPMYFTNGPGSRLHIW